MGNKSFFNREISFFGEKISDKTKFIFFSDLHLLLSSGIDIISTLEIINDNFKNKKEKDLILQIKKNILNGSTFSDALSKSAMFSEYEWYSVKIGEETGKLNIIFKNLSDYYEKRIEQKRKIISTFAYPVLVLITAVGTVFFMLAFIVPMFEDVFKRFNNTELPYITSKIISISKILRGNILLITILITILVLFFIIFRKDKKFIRFQTKVLLHIPIIGEMIKMMHLHRFCLSFELLLGSKTPLLKSIHIVKKMIDFYPIRDALDIIEKDILKGISLYDSMTKFDIFDKRMLSLVKVGEEINKLEDIFSKLKEIYISEIDHKSSTIGSVIEPILIIFIGAFVAIILISMYLPIFKLSSTMGGTF